MTHCCYVTCWANLGLSTPKLGPDLNSNVLSPLDVGAAALILIDDGERGWRVHGTLPAKSWAAMKSDNGS